MAADSSDPFALAGIRLLLHKSDSSRPRSRSHSSPVSQTAIHHSNKRHHKRKHRSGRNSGKVPLHYLKPGALAQLRDARKNARLSHPTAVISKKKRIGEICEVNDAGGSPHDPGDMAPASGIDSLTPVPNMRLFGPLCPQRKKLLAPKLFVPFPSALSTRSPATPTVITSALPYEAPSESLLESLPLELLVRIVCYLRHDELKPAFHVSKRLMQAVLIARQCHFDYTTPDRERHEAIGTPLHRILPSVSNGARRPATPKAPRQGHRPAHARIPLADLQQLAMPILRGRGTNHRSNAPIPCLPVRAVASHRVLFYEDELCQAVAQNTL